MNREEFSFPFGESRCVGPKNFVRLNINCRHSSDQSGTSFSFRGPTFLFLFFFPEWRLSWTGWTHPYLSTVHETVLRYPVPIFHKSSPKWSILKVSIYVIKALSLNLLNGREEKGHICHEFLYDSKNMKIFRRTGNEQRKE